MIQTLLFLAAQTYSHGNPSDDEQLILEMINRARRNPVAEGTRLGIDIHEGLSASDQALVARKPPLAFNANLIAAAEGHNSDMYAQNYFDHFFPPGTVPPASTSTPTSRMTAAGYSFTGSWRNGENIATGDPETSAALEDLLMVDSTISGRGHRKNLLDISSSAPYREVGIGFLDAGPDKSNIFRFIVTQDFARSDSGGPFLVGVVFDDSGSSFYSLGSGISGVSITIGGSTWNATTSSSGGYAVPVGTSGTITVTATKAGWGKSIVKKAVLHGENVKLDFRLGDLIDTDGDGIPDYWEILHGLNKNDPSDATGPANDPDGDGSDNLTEYQFDSDPRDAASTPNDPGGFTPAAGGGGGAGSSGGGSKKKHCGATGLEGTALLALLASARRRRRA